MKLKLVPTGYYGYYGNGNGAEGEVQVQRKGFSTAIAYGSNSNSNSDSDSDTSSTNQNDAASSEEYIHHLLLASSPDVHQQVIDVDGIDMLVYGKELDLPQAVSVLQTPSSSSNHTHTHTQHTHSQHQSQHQNNREHAAAATAAAVQVFDKILILVGHGEAQFVTEEQSKTSFGNKKEGDFCLSSHVSSSIQYTYTYSYSKCMCMCMIVVSYSSVRTM